MSCTSKNLVQALKISLVLEKVYRVIKCNQKP